MKKGLKGLVVAAVLGLTLAAAPPAGATTKPELLAVPFATSLGKLTETELDLTFPDEGAATAKITIYVPHGYTTNLSQAVGTKIADVSARISVGGTALPLQGQILVDDPAKYATNPQSQACAPGTHQNVWIIVASLGASTVTIPMYVDPFGNPAFGTYQIQVCLAPPDVPVSMGGAPNGARLIEADLDFANTFTNPATVDVPIWRALVTPFVPGTVNANPAATVEIRSITFFPFTVSLKSRYDAKHRQVILTGKIRIASLRPAGIPIGILSLASPNAAPKLFGQTRTKKGGVFTLKKKLAKTTFFFAFVPPSPAGNCISGAPVTAAPCVTETTAPGFGSLVRAVVKKKR
jgi:hypothetical protein